MLKLSLRKKFIIGTALLILLIGGALGLLARFELHSRFEEEIYKRGLSIARYVAEAAEIPLITENNVSLQMLVNDYRKIDQDIGYIFIVSPEKKLKVHTFGWQVPHEIIGQAIKNADVSRNFVELHSTDGLIYDIAMPIQGGALGYVHVGLYEAVVQKSVNGILLKMLPFVLCILVIGMLMAIAFATAITRSIKLLTRGVRRFSDGELNETLSVRSGDEIGQLAAAFNSMTGKLRATTVSREYMENLIDSMNEALIVFSPEGVILSVNRAYCELFEHQPEDVIGRRIDEFEEQNAPVCTYSAFLHALKHGRVQGIESDCLTSSGRLVSMLFSLAVMKDDEGWPQAVICAAQNISKLKNVQEALHQKQAEIEVVNRNLEEIVASRTAELAIGNESLRSEIAERQKKTEELRVARDAAESANRAKTEFLANMSHEMRTPLNSIIGGTEFLEDASYTPDQLRCLEMIRDAGDSLLVQVNDLLDLARIEAGQLELVAHEFNLADTLEATIQMLDLSARLKQLDLSLAIAADIPHFVIGDQSRLQQVMVNLVANAIKFTDTGGSVTVSARHSRSEQDAVEVCFTVRDTGIGIDPGKIETIFETFSQADSSITRRYGGSGLGLTISRRLVEAMGGCFTVESVPGVGSSFAFCIRFPLSVRAGAGLRTVPGDMDGGGGEQNAAGAVSPDVFSRLLLVDDSLENRELMRLLLKRQPLVIDEAGNGREALELFEQNRYALILMDIQMPIMDGYTATRMLRQFEARNGRSRTPVVALTAHAYDEDIRRCKEAGCDDHIAKPFKKKTLLQCLARYLHGIDHD
ncbi:MAG: response regulator [Desulfuromonadales bacterium]|nr:response regulator [Desulfuromonadales bacterium]